MARSEDRRFESPAQPVDVTAPPTTTFAQMYPMIVWAYQTYLGRSPSEAEILSQTGNGSFKPDDPRLNYSVRNIQASPEAVAYAKTPKATTTPPVTDPGTTPPAATPGTGGTLQGFDTGKLADLTHTTPKYVFARIAQQFNQRDPAQRAAMLAALQADPSGYFKNATMNGDQLVIGGTLDPQFNGINQFDVGLGSAVGWNGWGWQPSGGPGYVPQAATTTAQPAQAVSQATSAGTAAPANGLWNGVWGPSSEWLGNNTSYNQGTASAPSATENAWQRLANPSTGKTMSPMNSSGYGGSSTQEPRSLAELFGTAKRGV